MAEHTYYVRSSAGWRQVPRGHVPDLAAECDVWVRSPRPGGGVVVWQVMAAVLTEAGRVERFITAAEAADAEAQGKSVTLVPAGLSLSRQPS